MGCSRASIQSDRHTLRNGAGLQILKDVHHMGFIEGLDHLDAKALVSAENTAKWMGPPAEHTSLVPMRVPRCHDLGA